MFKDKPAAMRSTFWKHALLSASLSAFGLIWGVAQRDVVLLLLSAAIALFGGWRSVHLLHIIRNGKYRVLEGVVLSDVKLHLRNCHALAIRLDDGSEVQKLIAGKNTLIPGRLYRVYLHHSTPQEAFSVLPDTLKPAMTMLGHEPLDK